MGRLTGADLVRRGPSRYVRVRKGKGGKGRKAFVSDVAAEYVCRYLEAREDDEIVLFRTKNSKAFTVSGVENMLRKYGKIAGVENVHPHRFRWTLCTDLLGHGMTIQVAASILGHENISTTMRYVYMNQGDVKNAYRRCM